MNRTLPPKGLDNSSPQLGARDYYSILAAQYDHEATARNFYLQAIDNIVLEWIQRKDTHSIIDVGCANGRRLKGLLLRSGCNGLGLDVSPVMVEAATSLGISAYVADISDPCHSDIYPDLNADLVVSLWNVLGHIESPKRRAQAMRNMCKMLAPGGILIFDVNNRYNAANYGWSLALRNFTLDCLPRVSTGDFILTRQLGDRQLTTVTHLFSPAEVRDLLKSAGMRLVEHYYVDYLTGQRRRNCWNGMLCIVAKAL